jgi:hypothetical protein
MKTTGPSGFLAIGADATLEPPKPDDSATLAMRDPCQR